MAACDRPDWQLSDTAPVVGRAGSATGTAGTPAAEACLLDSSKGAMPVFWGQTVLNANTARREVYAYVNDAEAALLRESKTLFWSDSQSALRSAVSSLLSARLNSASAEQKPLLEALERRFKNPRSSWPNLWALRLVKNPGSEHMNPVRIVFREDAWFGRITDKLQPVIVDGKNQIVSPQDAALEPERVAALFVVATPQTLGATFNCEQGFRDFAIPDERMIESWSLGTPEILERLDADVRLLTDLFGVVRSCSTVDKAGMTFHSTVCNAWSSFGAATEYMAYGWSLANPAELYKPTAQNLLGLVDALESDRFEPDPFVVQPDRNAAGGGAGGSAGAGGAGGTGGAGGAVAGGGAGGFDSAGAGGAP
jgi:hypothetical protein